MNRQKPRTFPTAADAIAILRGEGYRFDLLSGGWGHSDGRVAYCVARLDGEAEVQAWGLTKEEPNEQ